MKLAQVIMDILKGDADPQVIYEVCEVVSFEGYDFARERGLLMGDDGFIIHTHDRGPVYVTVQENGI